MIIGIRMFKKMLYDNKFDINVYKHLESIWFKSCLYRLYHTIFGGIISVIFVLTLLNIFIIQNEIIDIRIIKTVYNIIIHCYMIATEEHKNNPGILEEIYDKIWQN